MGALALTLATGGGPICALAIALITIAKKKYALALVTSAKVEPSQAQVSGAKVCFAIFINL